MTVETQDVNGQPVTQSGPYAGNGVTVSFDFDFPVEKAEAVRVLVADAAGVETVLTLATDYTVDLGGPAGGSITLTDAALAPTGSKLIVQYNGDFNQSAAISNQGNLNLSVLEAALDKTTMHLRQLKNAADRAIKVSAFVPLDAAAVEQLTEDIGRLGPIADDITTAANNMAAIVAAPGEAAAAAASATAAANSKNAAAASATAAANSKNAAAASATAAANNATAAAASATAAADSAADAAAAAASVDVKVFNTVDDMKQATGLSIGDLVATRGYFTPGIGANTYKIVPATEGVLDGGSYIALTGSPGRAKGLFPNGLNFDQFGAVGDGVTDDRTACQNAINYARTIAPVWFQPVPPSNTEPMLGPVVIDNPANRAYGLGSGLFLNVMNKGLTIRDMTFIAVGSAWNTSDNTDQTSYMLYGGPAATMVKIERCFLDQSFKANGIMARAIWRVENTIHAHLPNGTATPGPFADVSDYGVAVAANGPSVTLIDPDIKHMRRGRDDARFFDENNYKTIGVLVLDSDVRILGGEIGWCGECVSIAPGSGANHQIADVHIFSGIKDYATHNKDGTLIAENPGGTPAVGLSYAAGLVNRGGGENNVALNNVYFDNCSQHLLGKRVEYNGCKFNSNNNTTPVDGSGLANFGFETHHFHVYAEAAGQTQVPVIRDAIAGVASARRKWISFHDGPLGETWGLDTAAFEASPENVLAGKDEKGRLFNLGDRETMVSRAVEVIRLQSVNSSGEAAVSFRDPSTTSAVRVGAIGDMASIRSKNGELVVRNASATDVWQVGPLGILLPLHVAGNLPPVPAAGWIALADLGGSTGVRVIYSDGTNWRQVGNNNIVT